MSPLQGFGVSLTIQLRALTYPPMLFRPFRAMNLAELDEANNPSEVVLGGICVLLFFVQVIALFFGVSLYLARMRFCLAVVVDADKEDVTSGW